MKAMRFVAGVLAVLLVIVSSAYAISGPVLLGFLDDYAAPDGSLCTHRGIDAGMASGAEVASPVSGQVRFAGRVPGPHGGSVVAVSIETEDGVVSMLPFGEARVSTGEHIEKGDLVGDVAPKGDPSSDAAHLHLGFKRGGVYADPSFLLEAVAPAETNPSDPAPSAVAAPAPMPAGSAAPVVPAPVLPAGASAAAPIGVPAGEAPAAFGPRTSAGSQSSAKLGKVTTTVQEGAPRVSPANVVVQSVAGEATSQSTGEIAPGVTIATAEGPNEPADAGVAVRTQAGMSPALSPTDGARPEAEAPGFWRGSIGYGIALLSATLFATTLLLTRRALTRRVALSPPVSDRLGILLQHLKAGDTLCGLTSCSGHAAFTVPGPLAQRR